MANTQLGIIDSNFTNSQDAVADMGGSNSHVTTPNDYTSISAMRTALAAVSGTYYTSARLDAMTTNDMVYALRVHKDANTISSTFSNTTP